MEIKKENNESSRKRTGVYTEKPRNQFMKLRYPNGENSNDGYPNISINELADEKSEKYIGLSKSIISKLESEDIDTKNPPCRASTLRLYKEYFDCSYDYLMGDTECRKPEYYNIGKDPILRLFDDSFYDNLKNLMKDEEFQHFNQYMLESFMSDPNQLQWLLHTLFLHLYQINNINQNKSLKKAEKEVQTAYYWFSLNTRLKEYFENTLMPSLEYGFRLHKQHLEQQQQDYELSQAIEHEMFEQELQNIDLNNSLSTSAEYDEYLHSNSSSSPSSPVKISSVNVLPQNKEDGQ